ncbi:MAG TPA: hypothetical protein QGI27_03365 [Flavobacteriaceae bacterium]|nr:hypothetical protein [Flavobacteriaceae bacterium]|tara:strand:+ start:862 stop:1041 length:180 start_codon:yes stop_codon:yes gene_type:complete
MIKEINKELENQKRMERRDNLEDKITIQKKSWSQKREKMDTDINEETYSDEFINFIYKI